MSLLYAENLLRRYNENKSINVDADNVGQRTDRFFTQSYLNKYDALYDKYKSDKNFNIKMWHDAFKKGDQDSYLAFLDQNRDTNMSSKYYDPTYYDYETMMLELYKPLASATDEEERKTQVFDQVKGKWVEESLGKMSTQAYIQYQLDQIHATRKAEIDRELEQQRKDELGWWGQFGNDVAATFAEFGEGLLTALVGIADVVISPFYATAAAINGEDFGDAFVDYFGSKGLTAAEKDIVRAALNEYERTHTHFMDIDGNLTGVGKYVAGISNSIGMMVPAIIVNTLTAGTAAPAWLGMATFYGTIFSGNMYDNANNPYTQDSPSWLKIANAGIKTGVEAVIEWGLGKVLGGTIQNAAIGITGGKIGSGLIGGMSKAAGLKYLLKSAGQEGLEEFLQDFSTNLVDKFTDLIYEGYGNTGVTFQTLADSFCIGALSSLFMSGGKIAANNITTDIRNKRIEKATGVKGAAELYIEQDGKPVRVRGARKLYYTSIISDFESAVEKLSKSKIANKQNLALAKEVYGALDVMSQFYSSFSKERIASAEKLLNRVMQSEQAEIDGFKSNNTRAASILTDDTISKIARAQMNENVHTFADEVGKVFESMVKDVKARDIVRVKEAVTAIEQELKEAGVTQANAVISADREIDQDVKAIDEKLRGKVEELNHDHEYDFIFTTDGHIAIEIDNMLFVSEAWLENYSTSDIYKFLAQTQVLKLLTTDKELQPLLKELIAFDKKFTGQKEVNGERAYMDLLFNKSVYEAFLLSHNGKNMFAFKNFIFRLQEVVKLQGIDKINSDKRLSDATKTKRIAYLNDVYERIKETMRIPTLKAVLNWNMNMQLIGADAILTDADREFVNQYQTRKRLAAKEGTSKTSAYEHIAEYIYKNAHFTNDEKSIVDKGLADTATNDERLMARALLNEADARMSNFDFEANDHKHQCTLAMRTLNHIIRATNPLLAQSAFADIRSSIGIVSKYTNLSQEEQTFLKTVLANIKGKPFGTSRKVVETRAAEIQTYIKRNAVAIAKIFEKASTVSVSNAKANRTFVIPPEAFSGTEEGSASIQFKADKLEEFEKLYGVSAKQLITGNLVGMSIEQVKQMQQDMSIFGVDDYTSFVQNKLEAMLGSRYSVVPELIIDEDTTKCVGFSIVQSVTADKVLIPELVGDKASTNYEDMFDGVTAPLSSFVTIEGLDDWTVENYADINSNRKGYTNEANKTIYINTVSTNSPIYVLIHEINHALQYEYKLSGGFNEEAANRMTGFLRYVAEHYKPVVDYVLRRECGVTYDDTSLYSSITRSAVARVAYGLMQGELWAEHYEHNGKLVKGFDKVTDELGKIWVVSPDGKHMFETPFGVKADSEMALPKKKKFVPDTFIKNAVAREFNTILKVRIDQENLSANTRDTFHTRASIKANEVIDSIVNKALGLVTRSRVTIDDIILAPDTYLDEAILNKLGDDRSEGHVFYFLKDYIENKYDSISIDRDANTHIYMLVDDNAFDDFLNPVMKAKSQDYESTSIADTMNDSTVSLNRFYGMLPLMRLKIGTDVKVVIKENIQSETRGSTIYISSTSRGKARTDAEIINTLNHEFRHLMQSRNDLETGFSTNINITTEMMDDLKLRVPEVFADEDLRIFAKRAGMKTNADIDDWLARHFIYYLVGGEKNAYAIKASLLNAKPIYVTEEAGKCTIFMPWYDEKTGEGRYVTTRQYAREEDEGKHDLPRVNRKPKNTGSTRIVSADGKYKDIYTYANERAVTKKKAEGTNLKYFVKTGERTQMDLDLQEFVIATTGNESKLPGEIMHAIYTGKLTKQALFKWFRNVDASKVNDYTFNLISKYMFKNSYVTSMDELDAITVNDPSFYWAAAIVLSKNGLSNDSMVKENSVDVLLEALNDVKNTKYKSEIEKLMTKFDWYKTDNGVKQLMLDEHISNYMRVFVMQWFDGTLAGAFYTAKAFRKTILAYDEEVSGKSKSLSQEYGGDKGDKSMTLGETISNEDGKLDSNSKLVGNDITALYELRTNKPTEDMIYELTMKKFGEAIEKAKKNPRSEESQKTIMAAQSFVKELQDIDPDIVAEKYAAMMNVEAVGAKVNTDSITADKNGYKNTRINIVSRIKRSSTALLGLIRNGKIAFTDLPKEVQGFFELKTYTVDGKNVSQYELKPEVYSVGRGQAALPGTARGRIDYDGKRNMADDTQSLRHDTTTILHNDEQMRLTLSVARQMIKNRELGISKGVEQVKRLQRKLNTNLGKQVEKAKKQREETAFRVTAKKRTSDTPNNFIVSSDIAMPDTLRRALDVSFEQMADTEVQFASRDNLGNLYDKETLGDKKFDSRVKHEVSNWDAFYEAVRPQLLALTRNDVLDIVEFFQASNMTTELGGPSNKLAAFEIFTLGYIVDAARRNFNNWDFSDAEKEMIEKLYEQKASAHGSGLNAVSQMLKVIDPFKRVRQNMLDEYNIDEAELDQLFKAVDALQNETDIDLRKQKAKALATELQRVETLMAAGDVREKGFGKRWYQKLKSARYSFMLSSPITWIRNIVSNEILRGLNKASDAIGNLVFAKKGYREGQWNLSKVQVNAEVKAFIDENIKNSDLFNALYESQSKYDNTNKKNKNIDMQKDLFVNMIVSALEQKYAAEHRFDSKTANALSMFITKMISDKRFIKNAAERYLGKILTIEIEKGTVDLNHGLSNRVLNLFAEAVIMSNSDYMHKRSFLADAISRIKETSPVAYEVLTFWQPFLNSSFNWFSEMLKYSPVGMVTSIINMCKLEKTITTVDAKRAKGEVIPDSRAVEYLARRDVGKGIIGMMLSILGMMLGALGRVRIDDDDDKFYIYVGDVKFDITNIFGTSSVLVGVSIAQVWVQDKKSELDFDDVLRMATSQLFEGFVLNDLLARHKWDEGIYDSMLTEGESVLRSFVPQFYQLLIRATNNEKIKYSPGMAGMWERWLNTFVPTQPLGSRKINPYTGEVETKYALSFFGEFLKAGILGPKIFWSEVSDEELLAKDYGINKGELTGELTVNKTKYSLDKMALNEKYGQLNKQTLAQLKSQKHYVQMPDGKYKTLSWDKMSDEQRANTISREMSKNAEIAKVYIWTQQLGKKYYASDSLWQMLRKLGITKNVFRGDKGFSE